MTGGEGGAEQGTACLADDHDLLLLDLDGVLYTGPHAVPGAVEVLARVGLPRVFVTNNASRPPGEVAAHLGGLGIDARPDQVTTSAQAGAALVLERLGAGASVLPVGGPGVRAAVLEAGLVVVDDPSAGPDAVLQGFGREIGWGDLCDAVVAVAAGALWVATNTDMTIPTDRGTMPGNGTLVAAVRAAVGVDPLVAAKPQPGIFTRVAERAGSRRPLCVGDRLDTDVAGARAAGMDCLLVLTGVSSPADVVAAPPHRRPTHLGADLGALTLAPLVPGDLVADDDGAWCLRGARARVHEGVIVSSAGAGEDADGPTTAAMLDRLAVVCAAAWSTDPGVPAAPDAATAAALDALRQRCAPRPSTA